MSCRMQTDRGSGGDHHTSWTVRRGTQAVQSGAAERLGAALCMPITCPNHPCLECGPDIPRYAPAGDYLGYITRKGAPHACWPDRCRTPTRFLETAAGCRCRQTVGSATLESRLTGMCRKQYGADIPPWCRAPRHLTLGLSRRAS